MTEYITDSTEKETKQYIVVQIGSEKYGIDIGYIDTIVRMSKITRVPKAQVYFPGIINLRGEVVPVVSLRLKMGLEEDVITKLTRIIIIKLENGEVIGILVDAVKEVVTLDTREIEKVSYDSGEEKTNFISGIGKDKGELISLFDLNLVFAEKEKTN